MYPKLTIDTTKVAHNVRAVTALCARREIDVVGVTKGVNGDPRIARLFMENGCAALGDSRVDNLAKVEALDVPKWLIRTPSPSDVERVVRYASVSLNSEASTLRLLNEACARQGVEQHGIVLMYDLGDLRDGIVERDELLAVAQVTEELPRLRLLGVAANLNCLSFVQPDTQKLEELVSVANELRERHGCEKLLVSGGNSATLDLLMRGGVPAGVNGLRLGESLLFGRERARYQYLPNTFNDAFIIEAEVVEAKRKPSMPWGTIGPDSYGVVHKFEDRGSMVRAVLSVGNQDIDAEVMWLVDERLSIVGSSCDHTVVDVTAAVDEYPVGSIVRLRCGYHAALRAFTSPHVEKVFQ